LLLSRGKPFFTKASSSRYPRQPSAQTPPLAKSARRVGAQYLVQMEHASGSERLFLALWPEAALQQRMAALVDTVLAARGGGRRAPLANLHMTLAFLGSVDGAVRQRLERQADGVRRPGFELVLDRLGCFRRRGLLWVGAAGVPPPLLELVADLRAAQVACGLTPDERDYRAHVTLARHLRRCPQPMGIEPIVWPVQEFVLVRSNLGAAGARYDVLRAWQLG